MVAGDARGALGQQVGMSDKTLELSESGLLPPSPMSSANKRSSCAIDATSTALLVCQGFLPVRLEPKTAHALEACAASASLEEHATAHRDVLVLLRPQHMPSSTTSRTILLEWMRRDASTDSCASQSPPTAFVSSWAALLRIGLDVLQDIEAEAGIPPGALCQLVDDRYFEGRVSALGDGSKWRWILYEPDDADAAQSQHLCSAHTDGGLLTVAPTSNAAGLQIERPDGSWHDADADADGVVVFGGDLLEALSNGKYRAARHRVRRPSEWPCSPAQCSSPPAPPSNSTSQQGSSRGIPRLARPFFLRSCGSARIPRKALECFWPAPACARWFASAEQVSTAQLQRIYAYTRTAHAAALVQPPRHAIEFVTGVSLPTFGSLGSDEARAFALAHPGVPLLARTSPLPPTTLPWLLGQLHGSDWLVLPSRAARAEVEPAGSLTFAFLLPTTKRSTTVRTTEAPALRRRTRTRRRRTQTPTPTPTQTQPQTRRLCASVGA